MSSVIFLSRKINPGHPTYILTLKLNIKLKRTCGPYFSLDDSLFNDFFIQNFHRIYSDFKFALKFNCVTMFVSFNIKDMIYRK
jgi:hypothetical protein